jgi:hypothetical protein
MVTGLKAHNGKLAFDRVAIMKAAHATAKAETENSSLASYRVAFAAALRMDWQIAKLFAAECRAVNGEVHVPVAPIGSSKPVHTLRSAW